MNPNLKTNASVDGVGGPESAESELYGELQEAKLVVGQLVGSIDALLGAGQPLPPSAAVVELRGELHEARQEVAQIEELLGLLR